MGSDKSKGEKLVKEEWKEVLAGLLQTPVRSRTITYWKAVAFIERVLAGPNEHGIPLAPDHIHYSVRCSLCKKLVHMADSFVYHAEKGEYNHYDCSMADGRIFEDLEKGGNNPT